MPLVQGYNPAVRTYSHALLTLAAARRLAPSNPAAVWSAVGATIPDVPAVTGAAWLLTRRRAFSREAFDADVCGRTVFRTPDAALHSAPSVLVALAILALAGPFAGRRDAALRSALAFVLGWAGHVAADALTHGTDARPMFWPLSERRFQSPVSYRERDRHALAFTVLEHALVLAATLTLPRRSF